MESDSDNMDSDSDNIHSNGDNMHSDSDTIHSDNIIIHSDLSQKSHSCMRGPRSAGITALILRLPGCLFG